MPSKTRHNARSETIAPAPTSKSEPVLVPAVDKAVAIIRFLNETAGAGAAMSEIADRLLITRSHCHNILRTLVSVGWLAYDNSRRVYVLSSGLLADTTSALLSQPHLMLIRPVLLKLAEKTGLQSTLCEKIADGSFLVVQTAGPTEISIPTGPVGYRFPANAPPQFKASIAWLSDDGLKTALDKWKPTQFSRSTIVERDALERDLAQACEDGIVKSEGEYLEGFTTLALPIFDRSGNVVLVVSCARRADQKRPSNEIVTRALRDCANEIHRAIDGRPPVDFPR